MAAAAGEDPLQFPVVALMAAVNDEHFAGFGPEHITHGQLIGHIGQLNDLHISSS
jgi:hypothetical protein